MQSTDPNVTNTLSHTYDHQCRCKNCTTQEISLFKSILAEARAEWLRDKNPGSWDAMENAEARLKRAQKTCVKS